MNRDSSQRPAVPHDAPPAWLNARLVFGLAVLALGGVFLADQFGLLDSGRLLRFWLPGVLLAVGLIRIVQPGSGRIASGLLLLAGGALLLDALDWVDLDWDLVFPLALILVGGAIAFRAFGGPRAAAAGEVGDRLSAFALLGGVKRRSTSAQFRGGDAAAVLGACEIDLTQAGLPEEGAVLDLFAFWGGVEVRVPAGWQVELRGLPILGGFEDNTSGGGADGRKLVVTGMVVMGGVEVKN